MRPSHVRFFRAWRALSQTTPDRFRAVAKLPGSRARTATAPVRA